MNERELLQVSKAAITEATAIARIERLANEAEILHRLSALADADNRPDAARTRADDAATCMALAGQVCEDNGEPGLADRYRREAMDLRREYRNG